MLTQIHSQSKKIFAAGLMAVLLQGCGTSTPQEDQAQLKVSNGFDIPESEFAATVLLGIKVEQGNAICTGTFVNDHQIITAAHCVEGQDPEDPQVFWAVTEDVEGQDKPRMVLKAKATNLVQNPDYSISRQNGVNNQDIAVVNFEPNTAPAFVTLSADAPVKDDGITIVGYGVSEYHVGEDGEEIRLGSGTKRVGSNKVFQAKDGMIEFFGVAAPREDVEQGTWCASGKGDSGGPMYNVQGELVGITSGGAAAQTEIGLIKISRYVDLNSPSSRAFLAKHLD